VPVPLCGPDTPFILNHLYAKWGRDRLRFLPLYKPVYMISSPSKLAIATLSNFKYVGREVFVNEKSI